MEEQLTFARLLLAKSHPSVLPQGPQTQSMQQWPFPAADEEPGKLAPKGCVIP